jgi:hypothetical protein
MPPYAGSQMNLDSRRVRSRAIAPWVAGVIYVGAAGGDVRYPRIMGRTALYRDPAPFRPARAEVQLDADALLLIMPDGKQRRHELDGHAVTLLDGFFMVRGASGAGVQVRPERRFVRMLILERDAARHVVITPPDRGAVAPNVVRLPEAPDDAAIVDDHAWEALADWTMGGGRFAACAITDLARLAAIATPRFAAVIGQVAAQRALEQVWATRGPLRGASDLEAALYPLVAAARHSPRVADALRAARAHAGTTPRRRHA